MTPKNVLLTAAGFALLGLGAIGAFVPILPTTPFVLMATACFVGNPRMRAWLLRCPFFAEHLTNYQRRTGLKPHTVAVSLGFLWAMLLVSMVKLESLWCTLLLIGVGIAVTIHILCIAHPKRRHAATANTLENGEGPSR